MRINREILSITDKRNGIIRISLYADISGIVSMIDKSKEILAIPFSIGDTVYFIRSAFSYAKEPIPEIVRKIEIVDREGILFRTNNNRIFTDKDVNKFVFSSKESAQEAINQLAWLQEENK